MFAQQNETRIKDSLGEEFEEKEHQIFGEDSFTKVVEEVALLEKSVDLFDLSQFTPLLTVNLSKTHLNFPTTYIGYMMVSRNDII